MGKISVKRMRIEWQERPLGLDQLRPRFHWTLEAQDRQARGLGQSAFRLVISDGGAIVFNTGKIFSKALSYQPLEELPLRSQHRYKWKLDVWDQDGESATQVAEGTFMTGLITPQDHWAQWITAEPDTGVHVRAIEHRGESIDTPKPMPIFERQFELAQAPIMAHLCIAVIGQYQLHLNGVKISADGLNGHWTDYSKRILYDAYDITDKLYAGSCRLSVELGNGFGDVQSINGRYTKLIGSFAKPQVWLQLKLVYADGSEEFIVSDEAWQVRESGTILSSIYAGEDFDARIDKDCRSAAVVEGTGGVLQASTFTPMMVQKKLQPKAVSVIGDAALYDFGLNHSGRPSITLKDTIAGQVVTLYPSELLMDDGTIDQLSMVGGEQRGYRGIKFTYICKGAEEESWSPQFTYTGYRYLQVEGATASQIVNIESHFMYNDLDETGSFTSSDSNLEAIHGLIKQALLSNTASVLTDCPHREKLGWLEQIYLNAATTMMNLDTVRLYEKMMTDMCDSQEDSGMVPSIVPEFVRFLDKNDNNTIFRDSPEWGAAIILAAWNTYKLYGDKGILQQNYEAMQKRIAYMETRLGLDGMIDFGLGDWFDFGPGIPGPAQLTSRKLTGTATFVLELRTLGRIANLLGQPESTAYLNRAEALKLTMQAALYDSAAARFDTGSQTAQAMAIVLELIPESDKDRALEMLIADIRSRNDHVTAGDIGFHYVVRALSDNGHANLLHAMLSRTDKPAYLEQIQNGATALTEAWDGAPHASQNHFMLGHAEIWLWSGLGGIDIDWSRDEVLVIAPQLVEGVDETEVRYEAVFGTVVSGLYREGDKVRMKVEIPPGMSALIKIPSTGDKENVCKAVSGIYEFTIQN